MNHKDNQNIREKFKFFSKQLVVSWISVLMIRFQWWVDGLEILSDKIRKPLHMRPLIKILMHSTKKKNHREVILLARQSIRVFLVDLFLKGVICGKQG